MRSGSGVSALPGLSGPSAGPSAALSRPHPALQPSFPGPLRAAGDPVCVSVRRQTPALLVLGPPSSCLSGHTHRDVLSLSFT